MKRARILHRRTTADCQLPTAYLKITRPLTQAVLTKSYENYRRFIRHRRFRAEHFRAGLAQNERRRTEADDS